MRVRRLDLLAGFFFATAVSADVGASEYRVVDAVGTEILFAQVPKRIIPLQPSLAELLDRIGVPPEAVVAVTAYTDHPSVLKNKPSVGPYTKPNLESIVARKPDLVLASRDGTPQDLVKRLRKLGIPAVTVATETLAGLRESYPIVGVAVGKAAEAKAALAEFDRAIGEIRERAKGRAAVKVLLQVGEDPLVVAGGKTFLHEGLEILGVRNVYADPGQTYPRVSVEDVLRRDPEAIVLVGMGEDAAPFARAEKRWKSFPALSAAKANRVVFLRSDALVRPGPRFPGGLVELESAIFGSPSVGKAATK